MVDDVFPTELAHILLGAANPWRTKLEIKMSGSEGVKKRNKVWMNHVDLVI